MTLQQSLKQYGGKVIPYQGHILDYEQMSYNKRVLLVS